MSLEHQDRGAQEQLDHQHREVQVEHLQLQHQEIQTEQDHQQQAVNTDHQEGHRKHRGTENPEEEL